MGTRIKKCTACLDYVVVLSETKTALLLTWEGRKEGKNAGRRT